MTNKWSIRCWLLNAAFLCCLLTAVSAQSQSTDKTKKEKQAAKKERIDQMIRQEEEGALIYQKQNLFGIKLYSDGWAGLYEKGILKTVNKTNLFSFEFGERKDRKEQKVSKFITGTPFLGSSLIYGKQNNFYFVKLGVGQSYLLGGKGNRNGVAVSAVYGGGVSLGMLKPYYLDVTDPLTGEQLTIRYNNDSSHNDELFVSPAAITGGAGVFKGFDKIKVKPGLYVKGALRFDYGRYNELISAIETGFNFEYYFSDMPIMIDNPAKKNFLNVFLAIEFGKRK